MLAGGTRTSTALLCLLVATLLWDVESVPNPHQPGN